eukprot:2995697-Amphidinium_carterae.1
MGQERVFQGRFEYSKPCSWAVAGVFLSSSCAFQDKSLKRTCGRFSTEHLLTPTKRVAITMRGECLHVLRYLVGASSAPIAHSAFLIARLSYQCFLTNGHCRRNKGLGASFGSSCGRPPFFLLGLPFPWASAIALECAFL